MNEFLTAITPEIQWLISGIAAYWFAKAIRKFF